MFYQSRRALCRGHTRKAGGAANKRLGSDCSFRVLGRSPMLSIVLPFFQVDTQVSEPLPSPPSPPSPPPRSELRPPSSRLSRTQTVLSNSSPPGNDPKSEPSASYITSGQALPPSHLNLHSFGSRFLPHSALPILALLPLFNDTKLLIGHMNGLSVLDMDPQVPLSELGSKEPRRRDIWRGEG